MCRKQVEQQGGETSEYHTHTLFTVCQQISTEAGNHSQQQLIMPLQPVRSSCQRYSSSFLGLFLFLFAFEKLKDGMNRGITLLVFHSMTSGLVRAVFLLMSALHC